MSFVLDASVALAAMLPDEHSTLAERYLERLSAAGAQAPNLLLLEVNNALAMGVRRKRLSQADANELAELFERWRIEYDFTSAARSAAIRSIMFSQQLSSYDAAYLELAQRHGLPLASVDQRMREAAKALRIGVAPDR
jgi:predicted nucleic acid-binding protein